MACRVPLATCHVPCRRYRWFFDSPRGEEDRFDSDRFVLSVSEEHQEFVKELRLTQAFSVFVQERTEILPSLAFMNTFDRCLDDPTHAKWLTRSQCAYQRASMSAGSKVVESVFVMVCAISSVTCDCHHTACDQNALPA